MPWLGVDYDAEIFDLSRGMAPWFRTEFPAFVGNFPPQRYSFVRESPPKVPLYNSGLGILVDLAFSM